MRRLLVLLLVSSAPVLAAEETAADRLPAGATFYLETHGLAGRLEALLDSAAGRALREHPAYAAFLRSPNGLQLELGRAMVQGATGLAPRGLLRAVLGEEAALAAYGADGRVAVAFRADAATVKRLLEGAEILSQQARTELEPAADGRPALWRLGAAYGVVDRGFVLLATDEALARSLRAPPAASLAGDERLAAARRLAGPGAPVFAFVDLDVHGARLRAQEKPNDLGQALLLGAWGAYVPAAPWAALRLDLDVADDRAALGLRALVPAPVEPDPAVEASFSGTLAPLPFALPEDTIALARLQRSLPAIWSHREALIAERAIPGLVEFETNFGNLTGGMSFVEQFLPALGDADLVLLVTRRRWAEGEPAPAVRLPQTALLLPVRGSEEFTQRMRIAFQTGIGILNATQGRMGSAFLLSNETYKGVLVQSAQYLPPSAGEREATSALPIRYNFAPAAAIVNGYFVLASHPGIVKDLIDGREGATPVAAGLNAGLWVRPDAALAALRGNREALIAQAMMERGEDRATAARRIDFALDLGRHVRSVALTTQEARGALGVALELVLGPAGE